MDLTDLQMIAAGNKAAEEAFVQKHRPRLLRFLAGRGIQPPDADDLLQEVFWAVFVQIRQGQFRGDSSVSTWMISILNRKVADYRVGQIRSIRKVEISLAENSVTDAGNVDAETRAILQQFLDLLPPDYRALLLLNITEGWTTNEIAERLNMKPGTVGRKLAEAKQSLRKLSRGGTGKKKRHAGAVTVKNASDMRD